MDPRWYEETFDEPKPIPFGSGTEEGHTQMWEKVRGMTDDELRRVWDNLRNYSPRNYYDRANGIGMDDWCYCISAVMDERGIKHFA